VLVVVQELSEGGTDGETEGVPRGPLAQCLTLDTIFLGTECVGHVVGLAQFGFWEVCHGRMQSSRSSWMPPSWNSVALLAQAVYLLGQSKKKKAMQAMSVVAKALGLEDVAPCPWQCKEF